MLWSALAFSWLAGLFSLNKRAKAGTWRFSGVVECNVVETTITCTGSGTLTQNIVREAGIYQTYTQAILSNITGIAQQTFADCINLNTVTLPNTLKTVGSSAFANCALTEITIPSSVTSWNAMATNNCSELTTYKVSGPGVYSVSGGILVNGSVLVSVGCGLKADSSLILPSGITELGQHCCRNCRMRSISVPSGVTRIGSSAFYCCLNLVSLDLPATLTSFSTGALDGCRKITAITGLGNTKLYTQNGMMGVWDGATMRR